MMKLMMFTLVIVVSTCGIFSWAQEPVPATNIQPSNPTPPGNIAPSVSAVPSAPTADGATAAATNSTDTYSYDPTGKRDPFRPEEEKEVLVEDSSGAVVKRSEGPAPLAPRELDPLEAFDLSQLKVSAIIWDVKNPRALLRDPNGGTHTVRLKSRLGRRNGFVVAIREGEIVAVEYDVESDQWVKSFKVLELR